MTSRSILTKNSLFIFHIVFFLTLILPIRVESYSNSVKKRSGNLQIELKVNVDDVDSNFLEIENFLVVVHGRHFKRSQKIGKDQLLWQDIPENIYKIKLLNSKSELEYSGTFTVKKGEKTALEIEWIGNDHRNSLTPRIWVLRTVGGWGQGVRWDYGSWQKTFHADGKVEIYHQGIVFGRDTEQKTYSRFDWDNDLISDSEDRDDDNDGIYDRNDRDDDNDGLKDLEDNHDTDNDNDQLINELEVREQVLGNLQYPIIESYSVMNLDSRAKGFFSELGDLIKLDFKVDEAGGKPIERVSCDTYSFGKRSLSFDPLDDGSIEDLRPDIAGRQISGDLIAGDGIHSIIIPMDKQTWQSIYPALISCKARNIIGKESQEVLLFPSVRNDQLLSSSTSSIYEEINEVDLKFFKTELENRVEKVELNLELKSPMRVKAFIGRRSIFLEPAKKALKFTSYSDSFVIPQSGLFILTVVDNDGGVFYLGEKVN